MHQFRGSVIGFAGDAITCWFDGRPADANLRAVTCALAMQAAMAPFAAIAVTSQIAAALRIKVAVATGPARRFLVGDPDIKVLEVVAGATLNRMSQAEKQALPGEVVVSREVMTALGEAVAVAAWRGEVALVAALAAPVEPHPWPALPAQALSAEQVCPWLLPEVYARLQSGRGYLGDLRMITPLMLRFGGLDFDHDPDAGRKLDAYIRWMQTVIHRYAGTLLELTIGDKGSFVYAPFGAPIAHEDDTRRALAAALELQAPPAELAWMPPVQIGVAKGQVWTGAYGAPLRYTYGVIGCEVNLAARLMIQARPGQTLVSGWVRRQPGFHYQHIGDRTYKGFPQPISTYILRGEDTLACEPCAHALVGRRLELGQLRAVLRAVQVGSARTLFIEGEAGIGKTRLVQELLQELRGLELHPLVGAGQSIEQHTPYRAWRDIFAIYFGLEELTTSQARQQIETRVAEVVPEQRKRLPLLNALFDLDMAETPFTAALTPELRQQNLRQFLVALLEAWGRSQPLIVILEDAHWLDTLSWQLAEEVARTLWVRNVPLLLIVVHRPLQMSAISAAPCRTLRDMTICRTLRLDKMAADELVTLIAQRLGVAPEALPETLTALVQTRSDGNPFFAEELLHALRDRGFIEPPAHITGDLDAAARTLPDTLHGLILARIDQLPIARQYVLKVAAVIGRSFTFIPLHRTYDSWYAPTSEEALRDELQALGQSDFTFVEALEPELTYIFKHIITQEAAYQTLLFSQRRELHALVAVWYAEKPALAPYLPLLVHHYHHAELPAEERRYARLAAEQAAHYYDNDNAIRYFSRALALTPEHDVAARFALLLGREAVYSVSGQREAQAADIAALEELAALQEDAQQRASVALRRAYYARATDDYSAALLAVQETVQLASQSGDGALETQGLRVWGAILRQQGDFAASRARLEQALALARSHGDQQEEAHTLYDLGTTLYQAANYAEARVCYEAAQTLYAALDDKRGRVQCALMFGALHYQLGEYISAQAQYRQALAESRAIGWRYAEGFALNSLGNNAFELGDYDAAEVYHAQALQMGREIGHREGMALSLDTLGLIHTMRQAYAAAVEQGQAALTIQREIEDVYSLGYTLNHLGLAWLGLGELERAEAAFSEALHMRRRLEQDAAALDDLAGLARVALARGEIAEAQNHVAEILTYLEAQSVEGVEFPVLVYLTCARVSRAVGEEAQAEIVLAEGRRLLETRAAAIQDTALRAQFVERAPFNRELAVFCAEMGVT